MENKTELDEFGVCELLHHRRELLEAEELPLHVQHMTGRGYGLNATADLDEGVCVLAVEAVGVIDGVFNFAQFLINSV